MDSKHYMNKSYGRMMETAGGHNEELDDAEKQPDSTTDHAPHLHMHPHNDGSGKVTVHVMHHGGAHEKHVHEGHDTEGMAAHIHEHYGNDTSPASGGGDAEGL